MLNGLARLKCQTRKTRELWSIKFQPGVLTPDKTTNQPTKNPQTKHKTENLKQTSGKKKNKSKPIKKTQKQTKKPQPSKNRKPQKS